MKNKKDVVSSSDVVKELPDISIGIFKESGLDQ